MRNLNDNPRCAVLIFASKNISYKFYLKGNGRTSLHTETRGAPHKRRHECVSTVLTVVQRCSAVTYIYDIFVIYTATTLFL